MSAFVVSYPALLRSPCIVHGTVQQSTSNIPCGAHPFPLHAFFVAYPSLLPPPRRSRAVPADTLMMHHTRLRRLARAERLRASAPRTLQGMGSSESQIILLPARRHCRPLWRIPCCAGHSRQFRSTWSSWQMSPEDRRERLQTKWWI